LGTKTVPVAGYSLSVIPDFDVYTMRAAKELTAASAGSMFGRVFAALSAPAPEGVKSPANGWPVTAVDVVVGLEVRAVASSCLPHPDAEKTQTATMHAITANLTTAFAATAVTSTTVPFAVPETPR
jgi:hypothetical protein